MQTPFPDPFGGFIETLAKPLRLELPDMVAAACIDKVGSYSMKFYLSFYQENDLTCGLREFEDDNLNANFDALMMALINKKPESIKGRYFLKAMVKTSMGPPLKIDIGRYATIVA